MEKTFDLGILTVLDPTPVDVDNIQQQAEKNITQLYQKLSQIKQQKDLINNEKKEEFQTHDFDRGVFEIDLPEMEFVFPRQKPLPKEKQLTKWEKFAREKGIKKKSSGYKQYDEDLGEMVPRYGPYSAKKRKDKLQWIREVKDGEDPYEDPFKKATLQKKLAKEQQKMREITNKLNQKGLYGRGILNDQVKEKKQKPNRKEKTKQFKQQTKQALSVAQQSTRSIGNFDKKAHKDEKKVKTKKRKEHVAFKNNKDEQRRDMDVLNFVMNKKVKA